VRSGELKIRIEMLTGWILKAFSSFVPKMKGCWMGTAQNGDKGRAFLSNFSSNLRIFFFFFNLYPLYFILQSAYSQPLLFRGQSLSQSGQSLSKQGQSLSKQGLSLSKQGHSLSPQALFALSWRRIAPILGRGVKCQVAGVKWPWTRTP